MTFSIPMRGAVAVGFLLLAACGPADTDPPDAPDAPDAPVPQPPDGGPTGPAFHIDLPQGEGIPVLEAIGQPIELQASPAEDAEIVATLDSPESGTPLEVLEHRIVTARSGRAVPLEDGELAGRPFGSRDSLTRDEYYDGRAPGEETFALTPADTVLLLGDRAEGTCFVRLRDELIEVSTCPTLQEDAFRVLETPTVEWWARVDAGDDTTGWLLVTDDVVAVRRTF